MDKPCKECGRMNLRLSWSKLRVHEECKQKGMLQRAGKQATLMDHRVFFPGTVTDRVVRDWLADDPDSNPGLMPSMVESVIAREQKLITEEGKRMVWRDANDRDSVIYDCIEAVTKIEPHLNELVLPFDYDVDFKFQAPVDMPHPDGSMQTVILNGFMDIIVRNDLGRFAVYDVKHTRDNEYWRHTKGQLSFYDLAVMVLFGEGTFETGLLQPLCDNQAPMWELNHDDRSQLMQRVMSMAQDIWKNNFPVIRNNPELCRFCEVKHACSKFQPVNVNGKRKMSLMGRAG